MKVFLLYELNNMNLKSRADSIKAILKNSEIVACDKTSKDVKADIFDSRYLIILADSTESFIRLDDDWRYFINEIRWKRKLFGEIIILAGEAVDLRRIPFALKGYKVKKLDDTSFISELNSLEGNENEPELVKEKEPEQKKRIENACKEAHVFESNIPIKPVDALKAKLEARKRELSERFANDAINKKAQSSEPIVEYKSDEATQKRREEIKRQQLEEISRNIGPVDEETTHSSSSTIEGKTKNHKDDPFPDYPHTPSKEELRNAKVGCGVGIFFVVFFFIVLVSVLSNL